MRDAAVKFHNRLLREFGYRLDDRRYSLRFSPLRAALGRQLYHRFRIQLSNRLCEQLRHGAPDA